MKDRFLKEILFLRDSETNEPTGIVKLKRVVLTDENGDVNSAQPDVDIDLDLKTLIKAPTWFEDPDAINS